VTQNFRRSGAIKNWPSAALRWPRNPSRGRVALSSVIAKLRVAGKYHGQPLSTKDAAFGDMENGILTSKVTS
jgi:hypothetical protein